MEVVTALTAAFLLQGFPAKEEEHEPTVDLHVRVWFADLSGEAMLTDGGIAGTDLDLGSDLDIETPEAVGSATLRGELLKDFLIYVDYWQGDFEGEDTAEQTFTFGGSTYPLGATVETELVLKVLTVSFGVPLSLLKSGSFDLELDIGLGLKYVSFESDLKARDILIPFTESVSVGVPLPVVALRLRAQIGDWIHADLYANGLTLNDVRDTRINAYEAGLDVRAHLYRGLYLSAGYHISFLRAKQEQDEDEAEFDLFAGGFSFGIGCEF